ncbi:unnamed protein product [Thelazia callipaeda]|uniref:C2H2-type domain-containing protein n=1 Tax=Thelazia callipaeda TaxID=103827 RepID=A0A0N5CSX5_THECL|nr:unnamed protein product [Thelazia callipaeda]
MNQNSNTTPNSDVESAPIDLSKKHTLDDLDRKNILEDKSNLLFDPLQTLQSHQQQLLELYAQLAANHSTHTDSEQSSDDGGNTSSYVLSPPSSNGILAEKIHPCIAERCQQRFSSRGALLWHILRRHPSEKLIKCEQCKERFADLEQVTS